MTKITRKTKKCCACKKRKAISQFHKQCIQRDGLRGQCKSCYRHYINAWRAKKRVEEVA